MAIQAVVIYKDSGLHNVTNFREVNHIPMIQEVYSVTFYLDAKRHVQENFVLPFANSKFKELESFTVCGDLAQFILSNWKV